MSELNEIAKRSAAERLTKAMQLEKMGPSDAARHLNILAQYICMSKQGKYWPKMPKSAWDRILLWVNSGETLHHFKPPIELPPKEIMRKPVEIQSEAVKTTNLAEKITAPLAVKKTEPQVEQHFTDEAKLKISLDIEINLVINGKKITL